MIPGLDRHLARIGGVIDQIENGEPVDFDRLVAELDFETARVGVEFVQSQLAQHQAVDDEIENAIG